ncbi:MAG: thioredoxin family protein [Phycisphaerae bacterium]|nr:thioredoxin family protein [Phycisphaerae bacterium]
MKIEILGTGCAKCEKLAASADAAAKSLGVPYELVKVKDLAEIMRRGVVFTPALAVDGEVKVSGKVVDEAAIKTILLAAAS